MTNDPKLVERVAEWAYGCFAGGSHSIREWESLDQDTRQWWLDKAAEVITGVGQ